MKYMGMPQGMWVLFRKSFQSHLVSDLGFAPQEAVEVTQRAKRKYKEIIAGIQEFEKSDPFKMNVVNCAMLAAFLLNIEKKPTVETLTDYYRHAMMTGPMQWFCRMSGKRKFTPKDIAGMKNRAALRYADRNPYSWNMEFYEYPDGSGYEARFSRCGICALMKKLGLYEFTSALCALDYAMSDAGGASRFVREYTLAAGGPYCDCGYHKLTEISQ